MPDKQLLRLNTTTTAGAVPVRQPCRISQGLRDASPHGAAVRGQQLTYDRPGCLALQTAN